MKIDAEAEAAEGDQGERREPTVKLCRADRREAMAEPTGKTASHPAFQTARSTPVCSAIIENSPGSRFRPSIFCSTSIPSWIVARRSRSASSVWSRLHAHFGHRLAIHAVKTLSLLAGADRRAAFPFLAATLPFLPFDPVACSIPSAFTSASS
jgi:hypothetical protein